MDVFSMIFTLPAGEEMPEPCDDEPGLELEQGECAKCGRSFHPTHVGGRCPARCGGRVRR